MKTTDSVMREKIKKILDCNCSDCKKMSDLLLKLYSHSLAEARREKSIKIEIRKADGNVNQGMAGFAAYLAGSMTDDKPVVLLNVFATLQACIENDISIKQQVIESLMHEFGHVLEEFYDKEFSEDFIEGVVMSYRDKYGGEHPLEKNVKDLLTGDNPEVCKFCDCEYPDHSCRECHIDNTEIACSKNEGLCNDCRAIQEGRL